MTTEPSDVADAHPPAAVARVLDPVMRTMLRTPISRLMGGLALVGFTGRRTGRHLNVTVGWHEVDDRRVVFTPASWRANFEGGANATVRNRGRSQQLVGTLVTEPATVAEALNALLLAGTPARQLGLRIAAGHTITAGDVIDVRRAMITFAGA